MTLLAPDAPFHIVSNAGSGSKDAHEAREQIEAVLIDTLIASGLEPEEIDAVVKTGGSSNIPLFSEMLNRIFGAERVKESHVFSSVTAGLAIRASKAKRKE